MDTGADIVIIAGDLAAAPVSVATAARLFPAASSLVLVGGNHEHYRTVLTIDDGLDLMCRAAAETTVRDGRAIVVLDDAEVVLSVRGTIVRVSDRRSGRITACVTSRSPTPRPAKG